MTAGAEETIVYGFAFADVAAGHVYIGSQNDSASQAALNALLAQARLSTFLCLRFRASKLVLAAMRRAHVFAPLWGHNSDGRAKGCVSELV